MQEIQLYVSDINYEIHSTIEIWRYTVTNFMDWIPITEEKLWETTGMHSDAVEKSPVITKYIQEHCTMIAGVLPFIGEVAERSRMIRAISEQRQCSTQTIRMTLEELLDDAKMDIQGLPDPTIGKLELRDYGYTAEDIGTGNGGLLSQLKLQNEMRLMDESWINYQKGKGNEEFQKYMEDLTDMQNHVLLYLQSFCSLEKRRAGTPGTAGNG